MTTELASGQKSSASKRIRYH